VSHYRCQLTREVGGDRVFTRILPLRTATRRRRHLAILLLLAIILGATGCSLLPKATKHVVGEQSGEVTIVADLSSMRASELLSSTATLTLSKDGRSKTEELSIIDSQISTNVSGLLPGVWTVMLSIAESDGVVTYQAETDISVLPGGAANVDLILRPLPGVIEVYVDPTFHPELIMAQRGRLYTNPGGYSTMVVDDNGMLVGTKTVSPSTYDFSIELFTDSFYARDRIYTSPWTSVEVHPGRTTTVVWNPDTGTCAISGTVDAQPAPPGNLTLDKSPQGLVITWDPPADPEDDIVGYHIWMRENLMDEFDLIYKADVTRNSYTYPASELKAGTQVQVALTTVDAAEQESLRTPVVNFDY
jgi:hypothetical protein